MPYGATDDPDFRYCEQAEFVFQCAKTPGEMPAVVYKSGHYQPGSDGPANGAGVRYQEAMSYLKKVVAGLANKSAVEFNEYFVCAKGCDDKKPVFIFGFENKYADP